MGDPDLLACGCRFDRAKGEVAVRVECPAHGQPAHLPDAERAAAVVELRTGGDAVNHPAHYNTGRIEVIDAIEDWQLDFPCGNAVKYIARAGKKDPTKEVQDLEKAIWYLARKVKRLRAAQTEGVAS